jgi:hypothetical protein
MIFRAIFWIGLVAVLMPREPDLGFGRPDQVGGGVNSGVAGDVAGWAKSKLAPGLSDPKSLCRFNTEACSAGANVIDNMRAAAVSSLSSVKADIEADRRARRGS